MADTYTTNLNLTKPEPGAAEDTWGISLNADLDALDAIFSSFWYTDQPKPKPS